MRFKTLTVDCQQCEKCSVNENNQFVCSWGHTSKIMRPAKGKKTIFCNLINKESIK